MTWESNQTPFLAWCFQAPSMQLFPCLPTAHPLFSIIICFLKLLSINNESRQRETSLLLISCHITSKTAPAKWAENGDGFNWKHPHLLHPPKINEAEALWHHTGKFNPHSCFRVETIKEIAGRKGVPGRVCSFHWIWPHTIAYQTQNF